MVHKFFNNLTVGIGTASLLLIISQNAAEATSLTGGFFNELGEGIVREDNTGKEWIRLDVTDSLSANTALSQARQDVGFRVANLADVNGLMEAFFMSTTPPVSFDGESGAFLGIAPSSAYTSWVSLFGETVSLGEEPIFDEIVLSRSLGYFSTPDGFDIGGFINDPDRFGEASSLVGIEFNFNSSGTSLSPSAGVFLVRDAATIPTPALLPGLIAMGIAQLRKRNLVQSEEA